MKIEIETAVTSHKELEELLEKVEAIEKGHSQENSYTLKIELFNNQIQP